MQVHRRRRRALLAAVVSVGALGIGACGSSSTTTTAGSAPSGAASPATSGSSAAALPGKGKPAFVMGDKNFPEENILGDLYQQALQAQGYTVTVKPNIGSTEVTFAALKAGQIDGYPEYDGTLLASVGKITTNPSSSAAAASQAATYAKAHGYVFTNVTPFTDSDAIAVTSAYAAKHGLSSIADLKKLGKQVTLAGAPEFATRFPDGLLGVNRTYGAFPTFKPSSIGSFYKLLDSGAAQAVVGFTTDPPLKGTKYKVLADPKGIFGYQNVGVVANAKKVAAEGPAFVATINKVSALLSQNAIIALNAAVEVNQQSAESVAHAFLAANHRL